MSEENQELQEFKIKGELIGTINLTDSFKKIKEITNHKDASKYLFIDKNNVKIPRYELDRTEDEYFPIQVIKLYRRLDLDENPFL